MSILNGFFDLGGARGVYVSFWESYAKSNHSCFKLWTAFLRPGSFERVPETPRVTKRAPRGSQKSPQNEPGSKKKDFLETLILKDPTMFWFDFDPFGRPRGKEKL